MEPKINTDIGNKRMKDLRVIISGGGTGGHIFPAVSIANALKARFPDSHILFVGAADKMEMKRVPAAGYQIVGLSVSGFNRKNKGKNITVLRKLLKSLTQAKKIIKEFKPDIAIGVGGYASGPLLYMAGKARVPTLIQEQNSYAGVTNKILAKKAEAICVAYEGMEKFFPAQKIVLTGNPCRTDLAYGGTREECARFFGVDPLKKTILIIGGSLGSDTLNKAVISRLDVITANQNIQIIWQCGERYISELSVQIIGREVSNIHIFDFVNRMDMAYKLADLVISRAGASSISELCLLAKPTILIPSPNVAEDHQTHNAMALVNQNAALMIKDEDVKNQLFETALQVVENEKLLQSLSDNIGCLAKLNAADKIVDEILKIVKGKGVKI